MGRGGLVIGACVVEDGRRLYPVLLDGRRVGVIRRERLAFSPPGRGWVWSASAPWLRFSPSWRSLRSARAAVVRGWRESASGAAEGGSA